MAYGWAATPHKRPKVVGGHPRARAQRHLGVARGHPFIIFFFFLKQIYIFLFIFLLDFILFFIVMGMCQLFIECDVAD
jgi:hypothetical protein